MAARILIVDDEPDIRDMLSRHLRYIGFEVETAANGEKALEVMARTKPAIIITDLLMPVIDGVELVKRAREYNPMVRMIIMTGYVTLAETLSSIRHGAEACLFKPLDLTAVERAVEKACRSLEEWHEVIHGIRSMRPLP